MTSTSQPSDEERKKKQRERMRLWRSKNPEKVKANRRSSYVKRKSWLKKTYGITSDQFDEMLDVQGGVCAICRSDDPGRGSRFMVDHDHTTGVVRGLLCHHCNVALGYFKDRTEVLSAAINYLRTYDGEQAKDT